jgi:hypothetical protein
MDVEAYNHQPDEPDKSGDIGDLYFNAPERGGDCNNFALQAVHARGGARENGGPWALSWYSADANGRARWRQSRS